MSTSTHTYSNIGQNCTTYIIFFLITKCSTFCLLLHVLSAGLTFISNFVHRLTGVTSIPTGGMFSLLPTTLSTISNVLHTH